MEEKIGKLIDALVETVQKMDDRTTRDSVSDNPGNLADAFRKTESQKQKDSNKEAARLNAEENARLRKKEEDEKGRKILAQVTPVKITSFDQKALKQLASISPTAEKTAKEASKKDQDTSGFEFMDILKGLGYAFVALVVAPIVAFFAFFKEIGKQKWFIALKNMLKAKFWEPIKKFFKPITDFFTRIKNSKFVKSMITILDDIWIGIKKFGKRAKDFFKPITRMFTWIGNLFGGAPGKPGVFMKIMNFFNPAKNPVVKGILTFAKGVGSTLGKLFLPITIIMGVIDGVMGFMKGYEEKGDLLGGIQGALTGVVNGLIMLPLDILKDGLSWILELVGLEGASAWLDSFSFQDLFGEWMDIIFCNVRKLWDNLTGGFTDIWDAFFGDGAGIDWGKALKGFMKIVTGIPAYILDILKDGISGILNAFGVDTTWLDSFDIMDIVNDTIDWFIDGITGIVDWFKLLFTEPKKAFKKIGDWFDKLWDDPVGTMKDMLPEWMFDVGKWVWDRTLGPIVDLWKKVLGNPEAAKQAFLDLMPEWMRDIAEWVYDRTIGPIVGLFSDLFQGKDVEKTFRKYLPDWVVDTFLWVKDTVFGPITRFWDKLFDGDIEAAFREILPDWLVDFPKWVWESIEPIFGWLGDAFDWLTGDGLANYVKAEYPTVYEKIWGAKKREEKRQKEAAALADATGVQAGMADGEDFGNEMSDHQRKMNEEITKMYAGSTDFLATLGHDTSLLTKMTDKSEAREQWTGEYAVLKRDLGLKDNSTGLGETSASVLSSMLEQLREEGKITGRDGKELEISKHVRGWVGQDKMATHDFSDTVANRKWIAKIMNSRMHAAKEWDSSDKIKDKFDDDLVELAWKGVDAQNKRDVYFKMYMKFWNEFVDRGGIPLGKRGFLPMAVDDSGEENIYTFPTNMLSPAGAHMAKTFLKQHYAQKGSRLKPMYGPIVGDILQSIGITEAVLDQFVANHKIAFPDGTETRQEGVVSGDTLDDFIMRPGQAPVAFNKGDILLGIHKDNPPATTTDSPELINRVEQMVITLKENKDLQAKMLEAMVESGMMDKQGNTVVNNGGNSTVVNNTTVESNIMSFRDRAVGRISNSSTKY